MLKSKLDAGNIKMKMELLPIVLGRKNASFRFHEDRNHIYLTCSLLCCFNKCLLNE